MTRSYSAGEEPVPGSGYRLTEFLGRGGFGEVWKAVGPGGTEVALKMIPLGGMEGRKEFRALQLVKRIRHPNLVPTIAFWVRDASGSTLDDALVSQLDLRVPAIDENGFRTTLQVPPAAGSQAVELIIAMGLGDISLYDRLQQCRAGGEQGIPAEELLHYMDGAAAAIDYLNRPIHDLGSGPVAIQHCDIKPHNIMIVGEAAQLCDFGLARAIGSVRMTTAMAATIAYAAPECLQTGQPSAASDQYSLAVTYYELRMGRLPYHDETYGAVMAAVASGDLDITGVSEHEQAVLRRATSLNPAARYPTTVELVRALRAAGAGQTESPAPARQPRRAPLRGVLVAFLLAALAAGVGWVGWVGWRFWSRPTAEPQKIVAVRPQPEEHHETTPKTARVEIPPPKLGRIEQPQPQPQPQPPSEAETHLAEGTARLEAKRYDEAIAEFQLAAAANPGDVRIFSRLGTAWWRKEQPQQAVEAFSQALELAADATDYVNRGRAYLDLKQNDKAYEDFTRAIQLDPQHATAHFFRADGLLQEGRFKDAIADLNEAIQLAAQQPDADFDPVDAYLYRGSALLKLTEPQYEQAADDFSLAIARLDPADAADVYRLRAECHQGMNKAQLAQYDQQLADILEKLQQEPTNMTLLRAAATLLATCPEAAIRNGRQAIALAKKACELSSGKDAACLDALAAAHAEAGEFPDAVRSAQEAVQLAPEDSSRSQYQSRLEHYQAGRTYWSTSPSSTP